MDSLIRAANNFIFSLNLILILSCSQPSSDNKSSSNNEPSADTIIKYNRQLIKSEADEIESFISRYHWSMSTSETGLRYMIYKKGHGEQARKGKLVVLKYTLKLINGDLVYSTVGNKPFECEIGKGQLTNGLEEGVLMMRVGDRAKFILPSHLAFGLLGDQKSIPQRATLVYDVELCEVKEFRDPSNQKR